MFKKVLENKVAGIRRIVFPRLPGSKKRAILDGPLGVVINPVDVVRTWDHALFSIVWTSIPS